MSLREEQCNKVCRILDDVLANRPTERDSLIVAVRKAFAEPKRITGHWIYDSQYSFAWKCSECGKNPTRGMGIVQGHEELYNFCPNCGAKMEKE